VAELAVARSVNHPADRQGIANGIASDEIFFSKNSNNIKLDLRQQRSSYLFLCEVLAAMIADA
jgi:hypothetical protein